MDDRECIEIFTRLILEQYNEDPNNEYAIYEYNLNDINVDVFIYFDDDGDINSYYNFVLSAVSRKTNSSSLLYESKGKVLFCKEFYSENAESNIDKIVRFLLKDFRQKYKYSKILDDVVEINEIEENEKIYIAKLKLVDNKTIEKCCVCYEFNSHYTQCKHNLCRICLSNIAKTSKTIILCPICRAII